MGSRENLANKRIAAHSGLAIAIATGTDEKTPYREPMSESEQLITKALDLLENRYVRSAQMIAILPTTALGVFCIWIAVGGGSSLLIQVLGDLGQESWSALGKQTLGVLSLFLLFLIPGLGALLLWVVLIKGPRKLAKSPRFSLAIIGIGLGAVCIAGWLGYSLLTMHESIDPLGAVILLAPLIVGLANIFALIAHLGLRDKIKT